MATVAQLEQYKKSNNPGKSNEDILMKVVDDLYCHLTTCNSRTLDQAISAQCTPVTKINATFDKLKHAYANLVKQYYVETMEDIREGSTLFADGLVGVTFNTNALDYKYSRTSHYVISEVRFVTKR